MKAARAPENLFWTPSSCSIISSARLRASSLTSAAGRWMRASSSLMRQPLLDLDARRACEVGHRRRRQAADPEEGVDLAILDGVHRLGDAESFPLQVLVLVEARGLDDAERHHLGGAAARAGGDPLALEVRHLG